MPFPEISFAEFASLPGQDVLVLTVNNRQSRRLITDLAAELSEERRVRQAPRILPLSAWIRQAEESLTFLSQDDGPAHVLDGFGARQLWRQVIAQQESHRPLLDVGQAAALAMDADRLMADWRLDVPQAMATAEYERLLVWRQAYHERLRELDAQDANQMFERVCEAVQDGRLDLSCRMLLLSGFAELSPRLQALADMVERRGVEVRVLEHRQPEARSAVRVEAPDPDAEWRLAAQWAVAQLRSNPQGRFAIIAAQLESSVPFAHRVLREAWKLAWPDAPAQYNIAVARPLSEWPLVRAAMAWLRVQSEFLRQGACGADALGQALLGGACAGSLGEASGRAALDVWLRRRGILRMTLAEWQERLSLMAPALAQAWEQSFGHAQSEARADTLDAWMDRFRQGLALLGFPGEGVQDSAAHQTLEALDQAMDGLVAQAFVFGRIRRDAALSALERLLAQTLFQPQRDPQSRLDVLGMLEAEGGRWDGVWVLGLTDDVLPAMAKPNPLLPLQVLRQANAPRATPARELQWAQAMYAALLRCAPDMWFSHARLQGEQMLRPSPFLQGLPVQEMDLARENGGVSPALETLQDEWGPALLAGRSAPDPERDDASGPHAAVRGGIGVLDTQARNPLWAFVKYRLGASQLPAYAQASDPNIRGSFLHRCIELVWRMLPGQEALKAAVERNSLDELLQQAVEQAAKEYLSGYPETLRRLESLRARDVLQAWLGAELQRRPFHVQDLEREANWRHGALELNVRLDRIDRLDDGSLVVIDYKTGIGPIDPKSHWMRERIVNLQLPFYAAVLGDSGESSVDALALVRLHARKIEVRGLADADTGMEGLAQLADWPMYAQSAWADVMRQWRNTIEALADEYAAGHAANRIWNPSDLDYCDVLPFLRLKESEANDA
ncbi:PD-(D/E)XK nuclease family protein [Paracandidimonas soli]|uniref:Putative DNA repair protein n=1 Tax=Paracandidimonas soli TaxID=1917182 RepID=A0A4R3V5F4_9BURK|nr:PD-(D/E)XK nuclease family protein [Paracandidimonas soli]TCU98548.1 putative DNA repair protein [Paracandidimonas soli]